MKTKALLEIFSFTHMTNGQNGIYLLVRPKYWGGKYFAHGSFPEVGQKQKTEKKEEERERD